MDKIELGLCECGVSTPKRNEQGIPTCTACAILPEKGKCVCCECLTVYKSEERFCCYTCWIGGKYAEWKSSHKSDVCKDAVVESVRRKLLERSHVGIEKYKTTLHNSGLTILQLKRHLQEELLDAANYLEAEIQELEKLEKENQQTS